LGTLNAGALGRIAGLPFLRRRTSRAIRHDRHDGQAALVVVAGTGTQQALPAADRAEFDVSSRLQLVWPDF